MAEFFSRSRQARPKQSCDQAFESRFKGASLFSNFGHKKTAQALREFQQVPKNDLGATVRVALPSIVGVSAGGNASAR